MRPWSDFLKDVRPKVPTLPEPVIEHAIRRGAQAFCEYTRAWRVEVDPVTTLEGVRDYDLDLDMGCELVRLEDGAKLGGQDIAIWRAGADGHGRYVYSPDGKTLQLSRAPAAGLLLEVTATVKPGEMSPGIDQAIFDRYAPVIAKGAVVAALGGDPLDDAAFVSTCDAIKTRLWRGNAAIRPRARPNYF